MSHRSFQPSPDWQPVLHDHALKENFEFQTGIRLGITSGALLRLLFPKRVPGGGHLALNADEQARYRELELIGDCYMGLELFTQEYCADHASAISQIRMRVAQTLTNERLRKIGRRLGYGLGANLPEQSKVFANYVEALIGGILLFESSGAAEHAMRQLLLPDNADRLAIYRSPHEKRWIDDFDCQRNTRDKLTALYGMRAAFRLAAGKDFREFYRDYRSILTTMRMVIRSLSPESPHATAIVAAYWNEGFEAAMNKTHEVLCENNEALLANLALRQNHRGAAIVGELFPRR